MRRVANLLRFELNSQRDLPWLLGACHAGVEREGRNC
jgi:hypothetical protein